MMRPDLLRDFLVTMACWTWFTLGFILCYSWRYALCALTASDVEAGFQRLNSRFYRVFFDILKHLAPGHRWRIDPAVRSIRSAVVVCNHLSYLDPLLLIALFERHRTIVKPRFFSLPIFGWVIRRAGYFPASAHGRFAGLMLDQMETMEQYLAGGGILFVFPEGSRSRNGRLGPLNRGALKIARLCRAPVHVLRLTNTDRLFPPGTFCFRSTGTNTIGLEVIDRIAPDYQNGQPSVAELERRVVQAYGARPL